MPSINDRSRILQRLTAYNTEHFHALDKSTYNDLLDMAIRRASVKVVKIMLDTPLNDHHFAKRLTWVQYQLVCSRGRADVMKKLIEEGHIDVNNARLKVSPLIEAVRTKQTANVRLLVRAGADVDFAAKYRWTKMSPAALAITKNCPGILTFLLDESAALPNIRKRSRHKEIRKIMERAKDEETGANVANHRKTALIKKGKSHRA